MSDWDEAVADHDGRKLLVGGVIELMGKIQDSGNTTPPFVIVMYPSHDQDRTVVFGNVVNERDVLSGLNKAISLAMGGKYNDLGEK